MLSPYHAKRTFSGDGLAVSYLRHPYRNPILGWPEDRLSHAVRAQVEQEGDRAVGQLLQQLLKGRGWVLGARDRRLVAEVGVIEPAALLPGADGHAEVERGLADDIGGLGTQIEARLGENA